MGALLYCMHVRLCMLNVSVEASRFKKAVINIILRVLILPYNGLFSTKEIKLRSDCNLLSYYHRQIFNYALYSCCIIGRCGIRRPHPQGSSLQYASSTFIENSFFFSRVVDNIGFVLSSSYYEHYTSKIGIYSFIFLLC